MNKLPYLLLSLCLFFSCGILKQSHTETQNTDSRFTHEDSVFMLKTYKEFVQSLPVLSLPLTIKCGQIEPIRDEELLETTKWFTPAGYNLVGRIEGNKEFYFILCSPKDQPNYPVMFSATLTGSTIALTKLFNETCQSDSLEESYVLTIIQSAETIEIQDSLIYHLEQDGDFIDSTIYGSTTLRLQSNGTYL